MNEIVINTRIDTSGIDKGIADIKSKLEGMSKVTVKVGADFQQSMEGAGDNIAELLDNLADRFETFISDFAEGFTEGLNEALSDTEERTQSMGNAMDDLAQRLDVNVRAIANTTANIEEYIKTLKSAEAETNVVEKKTTTFGGVLSSIGKRFVGFGSMLLSPFKRLSGMLGAVGSKIKAIGSKITEPARKVASFVGKFLSIAGAIAIFNKLRGAVTKAISALEGWGTKTSYIISDFKKSMKDANNALAAMFAPLIDTFLPMITQIINRMAEAFNKIGMFIAALLGKKTYTKAVAGVNDYKDAIAKTGQAADKAAGSLAAFDELLVIDTGNRDQEPNPFVTEDIPEEIQKIKSLKELLENIDWGGYGEKAAEFVNGLVKTIKEKIEKAPVKELASGVTKFVSRFLEGVDFKNIGSTFGTFVNKIVEGIQAVFDTDPNILSKMATAITDFVSGFFSSVNFDDLSLAFSTFVNGLVSAIRTLIVTFPVVDMVSALTTFISKALTSVNFNNIGATLGDFVNALVNGIKAVFDTDPNIISKIATAITDFIRGAITSIDFKNMGSTLLTVVTSVIDGIVSFVKTFPARELASALSDFISGAATAFFEWFKTFDIGEFIDNATEKISEFVEGIDWKSIGLILLEFVLGIVTQIPDAILAVVDFIFGKIVGWAADLLRWMGEKLKGAGIGWGDDFINAAESIEEGYTGAADNIRTAVHDFMAGVREDAIDALEAVRELEEAQFKLEQADKKIEKTTTKVEEIDKHWNEVEIGDGIVRNREQGRELERLRDEYGAERDKLGAERSQAVQDRKYYENRIKELEEAAEEGNDGGSNNGGSNNGGSNDGGSQGNASEESGPQIITANEIVVPVDGEMGGQNAEKGFFWNLFNGQGTLWGDYGGDLGKWLNDVGEDIDQYFSDQSEIDLMEQELELYLQAHPQLEPQETADEKKQRIRDRMANRRSRMPQEADEYRRQMEDLHRSQGAIVEGNDEVRMSYARTDKEVSDHIGAMSTSVALGSAGIHSTVLEHIGGANTIIQDKTSNMESVSRLHFEKMDEIVTSSMGSIEGVVTTAVNSADASVSSKTLNMETVSRLHFNKMNEIVTENMDNIDSTVSTKATSADSSLSDKTSNMESVSQYHFGKMNEIVTANMNSIDSAISSKTASMNSVVGENSGSMDTTFKDRFGNMANTVSTNSTEMVTVSERQFKKMNSIVMDKLKEVDDEADKTTSSMVASASQNYDTMISDASTKVGSIVSIWSGQDWVGIGANMVSGIGQGINNGWSWLSGTISDIASGALGVAKRVLGIASPSKVFRDEVGAMIDQGLALGIENEAYAPMQAMDDIANGLASSAMGTVTGPAIALGSTLPTQIASNIMKSGAAVGGNGQTVGIEDILGMVRQVRDQQQDLLETLIEVVQRKEFSLTPSAANGRVLSRAIKAYEGVTG